MTEVIGDIIIPKELIIPLKTAAASQPGVTSTGQLFMSGTKLYFCDGSAKQLITSA